MLEVKTWEKKKKWLKEFSSSESFYELLPYELPYIGYTGHLSYIQWESIMNMNMRQILDQFSPKVF